MKTDGEFTLLDIEDEINFSIANEIDTHFIVTGELACYIVDYLETEHEIPQYSEDEDESDKLYGFCLDEVYTISINANDDFLYFVQESYYEKPYGRVLAGLGCDEDIVYIESATNLTLEDLKRVDSKQTIIFDLEEDELDDCSGCNGCPFEYECEGNESDEELSAIDILVDRIENLEDRVAELESPKSIELHFLSDFETDTGTLSKLLKGEVIKTLDRFERLR